jgi:metallo-beta-lactamase class B IND
VVDFLGEGHTVDNSGMVSKYNVLDGCLVKSNSATDLGYIKEANGTMAKTIDKLKTKYSKATLINPGTR